MSFRMSFEESFDYTGMSSSDKKEKNSHLDLSLNPFSLSFQSSKVQRSYDALNIAGIVKIYRSISWAVFLSYLLLVSILVSIPNKFSINKTSGSKIVVFWGGFALSALFMLANYVPSHKKKIKEISQTFYAFCISLVTATSFGLSPVIEAGSALSMFCAGSHSYLIPLVIGVPLNIPTIEIFLFQILIQVSLIYEFYQIKGVIDEFRLFGVIYSTGLTCISFGAGYLYLLNDRVNFMNLVSLRCEEYNRYLDKMKIDEEIVIQKGKYIAQVAHDIGTPLQAFSLALELLQSFNITKEMERILATAECAVELMTVTRKEALDHAKHLEGLELMPTLRQVDLRLVIEKCARIMDGFSSGVELPMSFYMDPLLPKRIFTDYEWIWLMVTNLLSNAKKYSSHGQIRTTVHLLQRAGLFRIEVIDDGIGVRDDRKHMLFKPFGQIMKAAGGTGLGLHGVLLKTTKLGGRVGIRDNPLNLTGTVFWFEVPFKRAEMNEDDSTTQVDKSKYNLRRKDGKPLKRVLMLGHWNSKDIKDSVLYLRERSIHIDFIKDVDQFSFFSELSPTASERKTEILDNSNLHRKRSVVSSMLRKATVASTKQTANKYSSHSVKHAGENAASSLPRLRPKPNLVLDMFLQTSTGENDFSLSSRKLSLPSSQETSSLHVKQCLSSNGRNSFFGPSCLDSPKNASEMSPNSSTLHRKEIWKREYDACFWLLGVEELAGLSTTTMQIQFVEKGSWTSSPADKTKHNSASSPADKIKRNHFPYFSRTHSISPKNQSFSPNGRKSIFRKNNRLSAYHTPIEPLSARSCSSRLRQESKSMHTLQQTSHSMKRLRTWEESSTPQEEDRPRNVLVQLYQSFARWVAMGRPIRRTSLSFARSMSFRTGTNSQKEIPKVDEQSIRDITGHQRAIPNQSPVPAETQPNQGPVVVICSRDDSKEDSHSNDQVDTSLEPYAFAARKGGADLALQRPLQSLDIANILLMHVVNLGDQNTIFCDPLTAEDESSSRQGRMDSSFFSEEASIDKEKSVLLVDDDKLIIKFTKTMLEKEGYCCLTQRNGFDGLTALMSSNYKIAIIDRNMPVMDGLEAVHRFRCWEQRQLREGLRTKRQRIVIFSANADTINIEESMIAGADAFVGKPIKIKELVSLIERPTPPTPRGKVPTQGLEDINKSTHASPQSKGSGTSPNEKKDSTYRSRRSSSLAKKMSNKLLKKSSDSNGDSYCSPTRKKATGFGLNINRTKKQLLHSFNSPNNSDCPKKEGQESIQVTGSTSESEAGIPTNGKRAKGATMFSEELAPITASALPVPATNSTRGSILVVDDDSTIRKLALRMLTKHGFEVDTAENGEVGLRSLKAKRYRVAVLDMNMPIMGGVDCATRFREWEQKALATNTRAQKQVIFMCSGGHIDPELVEQEIIDVFLEKPIKMKVLIEDIENNTDEAT